MQVIWKSPVPPAIEGGMGDGTESCNRRRFSHRKHYRWPILLYLPSAAMAVVLGISFGMNGFFAGVYAGVGLTALTLVSVRLAFLWRDGE